MTVSAAAVDLAALRLKATTACNLGYDAALIDPEVVLALVSAVEAALELDGRAGKDPSEGDLATYRRFTAALAPFAKDDA